jgi:hypothetical protein
MYLLTGATAFHARDLFHGSLMPFLIGLLPDAVTIKAKGLIYSLFLLSARAWLYSVKDDELELDLSHWSSRNNRWRNHEPGTETTF